MSNSKSTITTAKIDSVDDHQACESGWFSYLVECADGSLYCGVSNNLARRVRQHNGELVGGAKYTSSRRPVSLKASWPHDDRAQASRHEYHVKQLTRAQKLVLIEQLSSSE